MSENIELEMKIKEVLHTVYDPEIPVNIYDLGLVYQVEAKNDGNVLIVMTLTAPGCPVAGDIMQEVTQKVQALEGVTDADVRLTFDPPWNKDMMTEEAKLELGFL
ncbi:FeS assembly SUF system protein [Chitinophaga caeni]|uniref:FeS assembly SUF system protein n=1 Tax=Chitinophaga caeni TaxID=2029983 RepID=A0A291QX71_9BACT|nr:iron-sulfur cluster assembly protein [Chitinophaga caeni]ATL48629.1 FeS assembly SUF system protein [Chitinophaga caeni]